MPEHDKEASRKPRPKRKRGKAGRPRGLKTSLHRIPQRVFEDSDVREALLSSWMEALERTDEMQWEEKFAKVMRRYPPRSARPNEAQFIELVDNMRGILNSKSTDKTEEKG